MNVDYFKAVAKDKSETIRTFLYKHPPVLVSKNGHKNVEMSESEYERERAFLPNLLGAQGGIIKGQYGTVQLSVKQYMMALCLFIFNKAKNIV